MAHMKANPKLSYEQSFTHQYLHPDNRDLKSRVDAESILHAQAREPAPIPALYVTRAWEVNLVRRKRRDARLRLLSAREITPQGAPF
jgi:hypothetical protein